MYLDGHDTPEQREHGTNVMIDALAESPAAVAISTMSATHDDRRWVALYVLCVGMLMIVLDVTVVNVALPSIQDDLHFSTSSLAWVVNAYLIAFGGLLLLAGRFGDLIGRRRIFLAGVGLFTAASLACGLAGSQSLLIAARFVQGIGGAMTSARDPRHDRDDVPRAARAGQGDRRVRVRRLRRRLRRPARRRRDHAVDRLALDLLREHPHRHRNRRVRHAPARARRRHRPQRGRRHARRDPDHRRADARRLHDRQARRRRRLGRGRTLALGGVSLALLLGFLAREATATKPLVPLRIFRSRNIASANLIQVLSVAGMFGVFFLGALYLRRVLRYDALQIGLAFLPVTITMGTLSIRYSEQLVTRFGARRLLVPGLALIMLALVLFAQAPVHGSYVAHVMPSMLLSASAPACASPRL